MRSLVLRSAPLALALLCAGFAAPAIAAERPRWQSMAQPRAPVDALRVYGNARPVDPKSRALFQRRQGRSGKWANPPICRVKYRGNYLPGELDDEAAVCVLFKRTRNGKATGCRGQDAICRIHVPVGGYVQVLRGASSIHLVAMTAASTARGTVALDTDAGEGDWRLCLRDGQVGVVHHEGGACQSPLARDGVAEAFVYADSAAYAAQRITNLRRFLRHAKGEFQQLFVEADEATTLAEFVRLRAEIAEAEARNHKQLQTLLSGFGGQLADRARALVDTEMADTMAVGRRVYESLTEREAVARLNADVAALVARVDSTLGDASASPGDQAATQALITTLEGYAGEIAKSRGAKALSPRQRTQREATLAPLATRLDDRVRALERLLGPEVRVKRFGDAVSRWLEAEEMLSLVPVAVREFKRLARPDDPPDQQKAMLRALGKLRAAAADAFEAHLYVEGDCAFDDDAQREFGDNYSCDRAAEAEKARRRRGFDGLPATPRGRTRDPHARRLAQRLVDAGLTWPHEEEPAPPGWTNGWYEGEDCPGPNERVVGPDLAHAIGWLGAQLGEVLRPAVAHWLACLEPSLTGGAFKGPGALDRCAAAEKRLEGLEQSAVHKALLAEVVGVREGALSSLEVAHSKACKSLLRRHRRRSFTGRLKALCGLLVDKERVYARLVKADGRLQTAISDGKVKASRRLLATMRKMDTYEMVPGEVFDEWRRQIDLEQRRAREKNERKQAKARIDKLMRDVPRYERQCLDASRKYAKAIQQIRTAAVRGRPRLVKRYTKLKETSIRRACEARGKVMAVHRLYRKQGAREAAAAVREAADSCFQQWDCD